MSTAVVVEDPAIEIVLEADAPHLKYTHRNHIAYGDFPPYLPANGSTLPPPG